MAAEQRSEGMPRWEERVRVGEGELETTARLGESCQLRGLGVVEGVPLRGRGSSVCLDLGFRRVEAVEAIRKRGSWSARKSTETSRQR